MRFEDVKVGGIYVLVQPIQDEWLSITEDSKVLLMETGSGRNCAVTGHVVKIPSKLYYEHPDMLYETEIEVEVGDMVVFSRYSAMASLEDDENIIIDGIFYFLVPYYQLFAAKRKIQDGYKIIPLNGFIIAEPIIEKDNEFVSEKPNSSKAKVLIIGSLNKKYKNEDPDDEDNIHVGDTILLDKAADLPVEYWDKFFDTPKLRIQRNLITAVI